MKPSKFLHVLEKNGAVAFYNALTIESFNSTVFDEEYDPKDECIKGNKYSCKNI